MSYVEDNIFRKIISGEVAASIRFEDDRVLAFDDVNPVCPVHILVIPKDSYINFHDFVSRGSIEYVSHYFKIIAKIVDNLNLKVPDYRLVSNIGSSSGQTVMHFHYHILAGKRMQSLL